MAISTLTASQEAELIAALKAFNRPAFEELYDRFAPTLLGVLVKMVKDEMQAQDLLQDSMIKIWKNIHRHDPAKGRLFTWLLNLTRNTAIDFLRTEKNKSVCGLQEGEASLDQQLGIAPLASFAYIGFQDQIIATLSARHWQVIELIYFQGYTQQEVADKLGLPVGTVKTWVRTSLRQLKFVFQQDQQLASHPWQPLSEPVGRKTAYKFT